MKRDSKLKAKLAGLGSLPEPIGSPARPPRTEQGIGALRDRLGVRRRVAEPAETADVLELPELGDEVSQPPGESQSGSDLPPGRESQPGGGATRGPVAAQPESYSPPGGESQPAPDALPGGESQPVAIVRQFTKVSNGIFDDLLRTLKLAEQAVYLQLWRLTVGHSRPECLISLPKLAERIGIEETAVRRAVRGLEDRRLIHRVKTDSTHKDPSMRGITFQISIPDDTPGIERPGGDSQGGGRKQPGGARPPMKDLERKDMKAPDARAPAISVYDVRKRAAQIYEARHRDPTFHAASLRAELREDLDREGLDVADAIVDEAVRGMM